MRERGYFPTASMNWKGKKFKVVEDLDPLSDITIYS